MTQARTYVKYSARYIQALVSLYGHTRDFSVAWANDML